MRKERVVPPRPRSSSYGDQLVFSVYTAPQGLEASPEKTDLTEVLGHATLLPVAGKPVVFADKEHIARASTHQTLMQLSPYTLRQIVEAALARQPGMAYSVKNPMVRSHEAVADVAILTRTGKSVVVTVELLD
jgi:hypothetical protein